MGGLIDLSPGAVFAGEYQVVRPLAKGGMGAVYVVEQVATGRERALKLMHPMLVSDPRSRERFEREARVGSVIESDHVVEVIAAGVEPLTGTPWLCMELLKGETVADRLERGALGTAEAIEMLKQLGHALSAAHRAGIVHRDLKPENLFLAVSRREGVPFTLKVLDFGVAALVKEQQAGKTTQGVGSPMWMAPEQTDTGRVSRATDVWALGLIAFQLLTGRIYWKTAQKQNATITALLVEIMVEPLAPASARAAELGVGDRLPPGFDAWFERCVAREPAARFQEAGAAISALVELLVASGRPSARPSLSVPAAFEETRAATGPVPGQQVPPTVSSGAGAGGTTVPTPRPARRTWLWALGAIAGMGVLGCGALTWTLMRGAHALGEQIAESAPPGTIRVGPDGVELRDVDGTEVHVDSEGVRVVAEGPMQPLGGGEPPGTGSGTGSGTEAEAAGEAVAGSGAEMEAEREPGSGSGTEAEAAGEAEPGTGSGTEAEAAGEVAEPARPRARPRAPRQPRLQPHQAAYVNSVVRVCWEGNPPTAPIAPTAVRFEADLGQFGQVTRLRMQGVPAEADHFRRCMNVRGYEYRFAPMPPENPVRFTYVIGS